MFRHNLFFFVENENNNNENEMNVEIREILRARRQLRDASDPLSLPNKNFIQRFRLSKESFVMVLETLNLSRGSRCTYIPPILRLCATLEVLGGGGYQWLAGNDFGVPIGQSTLSLIISDVTEKLESKLCPLWIKWRVSNESDRNETKQWFYRKFKIPGIVGCVDGTHFYFQRPHENEGLYFNRKGKHSLNAMVICDHKMRIMAINPKYAGSAHDSLVWKHSNERVFFAENFNERENNNWLLGDSGYPLEPWLLTPYRTSTDPSKTNFNEVHAKARNVIERCIGVLKGRWRILMEERKSRYHPNKIAVFANVCSALHNVCIHYNIESNISLNNENISQEEHSSNSIPDPHTTNERLKLLAQRTRDEIKDSLFSLV